VQPWIRCSGERGAPPCGDAVRNLRFSVGAISNRGSLRRRRSAQREGPAVSVVTVPVLVKRSRLVRLHDMVTHPRQIGGGKSAFVAAPVPSMIDRQRPSMIRQFDEDGQVRVAQEARINHSLGYRAPSALLDDGFSLAHVRPAVHGPMSMLETHSAWAMAFCSPRLDAHSSRTTATHGDQRATTLPFQAW
jgi:hypothetical protein